jgi:ABC-type multidrug transport system ATPase subunit
MSDSLNESLLLEIGDGQAVAASPLRGGAELSFSSLTLTIPPASRGAWRDGRTVLGGVSGRARPGRTLAIMGQSGAGKTSLLDAISARIPLASGPVQAKS